MSRTLVVAAFSGPDEARDAIAALEPAGVKTNAIRVEGPPGASPLAEQRDADRRVFAEFSRRVLIGGFIGAAFGAIIAIILLRIVHSGASGEAFLAAGLCGALIGSVAGGFIWVAAGMPRSQPEWETFKFEHSAEVCVSVNVRRADQLQPVTDILQARGATSIARVAVK